MPFGTEELRHRLEELRDRAIQIRSGIRTSYFLHIDSREEIARAYLAEVVSLCGILIDGEWEGNMQQINRTTWTGQYVCKSSSLRQFAILLAAFTDNTPKPTMRAVLDGIRERLEKTLQKEILLRSCNPSFATNLRGALVLCIETLHAIDLPDQLRLMVEPATPLISIVESGVGDVPDEASAQEALRAMAEYSERVAVERRQRAAAAAAEMEIDEVALSALGCPYAAPSTRVPPIMFSQESLPQAEETDDEAEHLPRSRRSRKP